MSKSDIPNELGYVSYWTNIKNKEVMKGKGLNLDIGTLKNKKLIIPIKDTIMYFPPLDINSTEFTMKFKDSTITIPNIEYKIIGKTKDTSTFFKSDNGNIYRNAIVYTYDICQLNNVTLSNQIQTITMNIPIILDELIVTLITNKDNVACKEDKVDIPINDIDILNFYFHFITEPNQQFKQYLDFFENSWNEYFYEFIKHFLLTNISKVTFFNSSEDKKLYDFLCSPPIQPCYPCDICCNDKVLQLSYVEIIKYKNDSYCMNGIKWCYGDISNTLDSISGMNKDEFIQKIYTTLLEDINEVAIYVCKDLDISTSLQNILSNLYPLL